MSLLLSRRDVDFLLFEWLDTEALTAHARYADHARATLDGLLDLSEELAEELFAPHNRRNDLEEPVFDGQQVILNDDVKKAVAAFAEADLLAAPLPPDVGGLGVPEVVHAAAMAYFYAANAGTTAYELLTLGNVRLLLEHGTADDIERYVKPMINGRFMGTMALSEPASGSNLADITTRAEPQDDGTYRVFGQKMWISAGDHELGENIVHLVLAKIPGGPAGTKGISLFIVPKYLVNDDGSIGERNDVVLSGINHKMGYRGTVNTAPSFGSGAFTPGGHAGAVGYLVGEQHRGLAYMFHMMNEARIAIGLSAAAIGYTGYLKSLAYARERLQGRAVGASLDDPQVAIIEHTDVRRMLLAQKAYVEGGLALCLYAARTFDETKVADEQRSVELHELLDVLTPIVKSWPSQWCLEANSLAIQVLGGAGYTRDFDVEQHYRDNRLNAIHEGTHGIQALDLLGRKILGTQGRGLARLLGFVNETIARAETFGGEAAVLAAQLRTSCERLIAATAAIGALGSVDRMLANATVYLEACGHVVVAWQWLDQFLATLGHDGDFYDGKRQAARYFFAFELPKTDPQFDLLAAGDATTLEMHPEWY